MIVIACVDQQNGLMFHDRRQSQDRNVIQKIVEITKDSVLWVSKYSLELFDKSATNIHETHYPSVRASKGEYCFLEDSSGMLSVSDVRQDIETVILFRWPNIYPADEYFPVDVLNGKKLTKIFEFTGTSHDKITLEVYEF